MNAPAVRIAALGVCLTVLVGLFVLSGANVALSDPDQRTAGETTTVTGTVVATDPAAVELPDGGTVSIPGDGPGALSIGDRVAVDVTVRPSDSRPGVVQPGPWQRPFMYGVSALAGLLVLGRVLAHWRFDPRRLRFEPRAAAGGEQRSSGRSRDGRAPGDEEAVPDHVSDAGGERRG